MNGKLVSYLLHRNVNDIQFSNKKKENKFITHDWINPIT